KRSLPLCYFHPQGNRDRRGEHGSRKLEAKLEAVSWKQSRTQSLKQSWKRRWKRSWKRSWNQSWNQRWNQSLQNGRPPTTAVRPSFGLPPPSTLLPSPVLVLCPLFLFFPAVASLNP
ncbi:unnamed protein product, partial [Laminaria digitata]